MENYLDASPMIRALSESPNEFEMKGNLVRHRPSRHMLRFDVRGKAQLVARCNCAELAISREQSDTLRAAVTIWKETYWRPLITREAAERRVAEINRAFAEHFRTRSNFWRAFDAVLSFLRIGDRVSFGRVDLVLPKGDELRARPTTATQEPESNELASV